MALLCIWPSEAVAMSTRQIRVMAGSLSMQIVERVVTHDRISGNRFVTHYAYHHEYFDVIEREFRGFGMVEAAGIEPASAWCPAGASTCVGVVRSRRGSSRHREASRPDRLGSRSRMRSVSGREPVS